MLFLALHTGFCIKKVFSFSFENDLEWKEVVNCSGLRYRQQITAMKCFLWSSNLRNEKLKYEPEAVV